MCDHGAVDRSNAGAVVFIELGCVTRRCRLVGARVLLDVLDRMDVDDE